MHGKPRRTGRNRPHIPRRARPAPAPAGGLSGGRAGLGHRVGAGPRADSGDSEHPGTLHACGRERLRRGDLRGALPYLEQAVSIAPGVGTFHESLADLYRAMGESERAEAECRLALRFDSSLDHARNLLGLILLDRGETQAALEEFLGAIRAKPPCPEGLVNAAVAFNRLGDHERAIASSRRVLALEPRSPHAWTNLGMALRALGRREEARDAFTRAGDSPLARFNLGYLDLQEDDLARGLPLLELRRRILPIGRDLGGQAWSGGVRPGRVLLVVPEQGLGDTILMSQFYPRLLPLFREVVALVQKPLGRLIARAFPALRVVTDLDGVSYDEWCPTMSLPYLLGIRDVSEIPRRAWLGEGITRGPRPAAGPLRVGINWAGNPLFAYDAVRSTHLDRLAMLFQAGGVEWSSLHKGHLEEEATRFGLPAPLRTARDFFETAEVLAGLDLVVSTETAVPNLSAALGIPTCVLSTPDPDWRWASWYEGVTVCRQEVAGNWFGAIAGALTAIQRLVSRGDLPTASRAA